MPVAANTTARRHPSPRVRRGWRIDPAARGNESRRTWCVGGKMFGAPKGGEENDDED